MTRERTDAAACAVPTGRVTQAMLVWNCWAKIRSEKAKKTAQGSDARQTLAPGCAPDFGFRRGAFE